MRGGGVFGVISLALLLGAAGNALANPKGVSAAGGALSSLLKSNLQAASGQKITG